MKPITLYLRPIPPFRLDLTVWTLRRRPENFWDHWDGTKYRRGLVLNGNPIAIEVVQTDSPDHPVLKITAWNKRKDSACRCQLKLLISRVLGINTDLSPFYAMAARDKKLGILAKKFRGMKPPRYPSLFEALVNAITCQQFTLTAGIRLLGRLVAHCGDFVPGPEGPLYAFPGPRALSQLKREDLRALGFSWQKAHALVELALLVEEGKWESAILPSFDDEQALHELRGLRGVGRWTAEYALLRGLGRIHIFPGDDVGVRNHLRKWLNPAKSLDYEGTRRILAKWRPFGGLIYFHLLLNNLAEKGYVKENR